MEFLLFTHSSYIEMWSYMIVWAGPLSSVLYPQFLKQIDLLHNHLWLRKAMIAATKCQSGGFNNAVHKPLSDIEMLAATSIIYTLYESV